MSYLPPSSLYLHEPEPHPEPIHEPTHGPHPETEPHIEPLRLGSAPATQAPTHAPFAAPGQVFVTAPSIPHTVDRVLDEPPPDLPRLPTMPPMAPTMSPPHAVEHVIEHIVERAPEPPPHVVEHIIERIVERPHEPPQVVERIIERVIERQAPAPEPVHEHPAPTPAPVLSSTATPIHAVKGPKDWLVASPPEFLVEEHAEPRRIHIEETQPEPTHEPRHEPLPEPRHEHRHEPRRETQAEPVHAARPEPTETRPAPPRKPHFLHRAHRSVMRHLKRDKTQPADPGDKELLWMAAMALGSVCVGLMIWGAYSTLPRPGYLGGLRADASFPKLKVVSGEYGPGYLDPNRRHHEAPPVLTGIHVPPPPTHVLPPSPPEHRKALEPPPTFRPTSDPKMGPFREIEQPLQALPHRADPAIFVKAHLGETPMIRTWENLAKYSMMLTALAAAPTVPAFVPTAVAQAQPLAPVDNSKLDELTRAVNKLTAEVNRLKDIDEKIDAVKSEVEAQIAKIKVEPHDDSDIKLQLASIQKTLKFLLENPQAAPAQGGVALPAAANTSRIESELVSIKEAILKLRPNDRVALSPPDMPPATMPTKSARVIFVNLYDKDLYLWVNEKPHRVAKQTTFTIENVAPGTAKIEVKTQDETYHRVSPSLTANETYTLTAR